MTPSLLQILEGIDLLPDEPDRVEWVAIGAEHRVIVHARDGLRPVDRCPGCGIEL